MLPDFHLQHELVEYTVIGEKVQGNLSAKF